MDKEIEIEIVKMGLKLMEIEYNNFNACLEHCKLIRHDRQSLRHYTNKVKEEIYNLKKVNHLTQ